MFVKFLKFNTSECVPLSFLKSLCHLTFHLIDLEVSLMNNTNRKEKNE